MPQSRKKEHLPTFIYIIYFVSFTLGFGFNIRGGVDHPHVGSDPGIFITTVRADSTAGVDGRLEPGDRILAVSARQSGCVSFSFVDLQIQKKVAWRRISK